MSTRTVIFRLDDLLKPLGFVRRAATWNLRNDPVSDVVNVQTSKAGNAMTVNAGVLDEDVYAKLCGLPPPAFIQQPACTVCVRIGELVNGKDLWWQLGNQRVADEVADMVSARVLPFLQSMHSRAAMRQWLITAEVTKKKYPPPILNLAILNSLLGESDSGCEIIAELKKKALGGWRDRAAEVAGRLQCAESFRA